jgi:hypothetical protein
MVVFMYGSPYQLTHTDCKQVCRPPFTRSRRVAPGAFPRDSYAAHRADTRLPRLAKPMGVLPLWMAGSDPKRSSPVPPRASLRTSKRPFPLTGAVAGPVVSDCVLWLCGQTAA